MARSRYSGSVDEIMENLKKEQSERPANDRIVENILADLGIETGGVNTSSIKAPAAEKRDASRKSEPKEPIRPAKREETPKKRDARKQSSKAAANPHPQEKRTAKKEKKSEHKAAAAEKSSIVIPPLFEDADPENAVLETWQQSAQPAMAPVEKQPKKHRQQAPSYPLRESHAEEPEETEEISAPSIGGTIQLDQEFQKFFSQSVAVIPDEDGDQHPGFFARFLHKRKGDEPEFDEDEDDFEQSPAAWQEEQEDEDEVLLRAESGDNQWPEEELDEEPDENQWQEEEASESQWPEETSDEKLEEVPEEQEPAEIKWEEFSWPQTEPEEPLPEQEEKISWPEEEAEEPEEQEEEPSWMQEFKLGDSIWDEPEEEPEPESEPEPEPEQELETELSTEAFTGKIQFVQPSEQNAEPESEMELEIPAEPEPEDWAQDDWAQEEEQEEEEEPSLEESFQQPEEEWNQQPVWPEEIEEDVGEDVEEDLGDDLGDDLGEIDFSQVEQGWEEPADQEEEPLPPESSASRMMDAAQQLYDREPVSIDDAPTSQVEIQSEDGVFGKIQLNPIEEAPKEPEKHSAIHFPRPKLFGSEEDGGDPFVEDVPQGYVEDYESPEDAPHIEADLGKMRAGAGLRAALSGILGLLLLYLGLAVGDGILPPFPVLDPAVSPAAFLSVQLMLLLVVCGINWRVFAKGIPGIWSTPSPDSMPALAALAAVAQLGYDLVNVDSFDPAATTIFASAAALLLCVNAIGRMVMSGVVLRNFQMISSSTERSATTLVRDRELTARIARDMGEPEPCLLANRPAGFVRGFLRHSFSPRSSDYMTQKCTWVLLGGAAVSALVCAFTGKGMGAALTALAGTLCLGAPIAATLLSAVPALLMQKSASRVGAVIPGWSAVAQLGRANMVVAGAKDLFPSSSVRLHGIKTFEKQRIDLAILYAASVLVDSCDTLRDVFMEIIENRTDILYPAENLENHPGRGFIAWVDNSRVIVGNRQMMKEQGVEIPSLDYENRYTKGKREPIYLAVSGRVFAMFMVSYRANPQAAETLATLRRQGISVLVKSDDFCLTSKLISEIYELPLDCVKVLGAEERSLLDPFTTYVPDSEGCMNHMGSFTSFVGGLTAAAGAASGERNASLVQSAGIVLSCILAILLAFTSGMAQLSLGAVLLYSAVWGVLTLAMPLLRNY